MNLPSGKKLIVNSSSDSLLAASRQSASQPCHGLLSDVSDTKTCKNEKLHNGLRGGTPYNLVNVPQVVVDGEPAETVHVHSAAKNGHIQL